MPVVVVRTEAADPADIKPVPPPAATDWAYLGSIITPAKRSALVRVDGQQQIYSIGSTHGDAKLVTIESGFIEVEIGTDNKETKKITLNERTLLAPTDPPKHPIAFRAPPTIGAGMPGLGAAGTMNFNAANRTAAAMMVGNPPAATMDQARMAMMAANEAAARAKMAAEAPGITPMENLSQDDLQNAAKYLNDPSIGEEARAKYLSQLGIGRGATTDMAIERLKASGVDISGSAGKYLMQAIDNNSRAKP
jgi:hypothetical protein